MIWKVWLQKFDDFMWENLGTTHEDFEKQEFEELMEMYDAGLTPDEASAFYTIEV